VHILTHAEDQGAIAKDDVSGIVVTTGLSDIAVDRHDELQIEKRCGDRL
jgi:hypothetical protein